MGDFLDDCLNLESQFYQSGFEQGREDGRVLGRDEGRILGIKEGWDLGFELGSYLGVAEALRARRSSKRAEDGALAAERKLGRLVDAVYESLMASSLGSGREVAVHGGDMQRGDVHPRNEEMQAFVKDVRAKFRMILALVGEEERRRINRFLDGGSGVGGSGAVMTLDF